MVQERKIALLVDAENVSHHRIGQVMAAVKNNLGGLVTVKRIYADWTKPNISDRYRREENTGIFYHACNEYIFFEEKQDLADSVASFSGSPFADREKKECTPQKKTPEVSRKLIAL